MSEEIEWRRLRSGEDDEKPIDDRVSTRAKLCIMGNIGMGQYVSDTGTMLPKKHVHLMEPILKLFGTGIIIVDVYSGELRCAITFLAPLHSLSQWEPGNNWIQQIAVCDNSSITVEVKSRSPIDTEMWQLGTKRTHKLNEFPKPHFEIVRQIAGDDKSFQLIWRTMGLISMWERNVGDDLSALVHHLEDCA